MKRGLRSFLFVPGDDERKLMRSLASDADALIFDLEDAVAGNQKDIARAQVVGILQTHGHDREILVRINGTDTPWYRADVAALESTNVAAIVLPKASAASVAQVSSTNVPLVALIETALGVEDSLDIARDPNVVRLMLGSADFVADLGISFQPDESEMQYPRARIAIASAAAGKEAPIDLVHLDVHDQDALCQSAARGKALGFAAKACIHPTQVALVNEAFAPTNDELNWAHDVVGAYEAAEKEGHQVTVVQGKMIDLPVVTQARRLVDSGRLGRATATSGKETR